MSNKNIIHVIVNKHFEVEPFVAALMSLNRDGKLDFPMPTQLNIPTDGTDRMSKPRASYRTDELNFDVDVWCIEDLMPADVNASNSEEKYKVLPQFFHEQFKNKLTDTSLVISVSTAESTPDIQKYNDGQSVNGSVIFGQRYYMFDVHSMGSDDPDPDSGSKLIINKRYCENLSQVINTVNRIKDIAPIHFWQQKYSPYKNMKCWGNPTYLSVGVVNVTNYEAYPIADKAAYEDAQKNSQTSQFVPVCIETTHGIVNSAVLDACNQLKIESIPVLFTSPITDRYLCFGDDVGTTGLQNYIAGYNGGIAVGHLLKILNDEYKET